MLVLVRTNSCRTGEPQLPMTARRNKETRSMHDLLIALAFVGMIVAPAIVAAKSAADSIKHGE